MGKILPTIGPVTEKPDNLRKVLKYSDIIRINGSHNNLMWHKSIARNVKKINKNSKILLDIPGIKPRTANKERILINKNEQIIFYYKTKIKKKLKSIPITNPLPEISKKSRTFSISDGQHQFIIKEKGKNYIIGKSKEKFNLLEKKGLNIPFSVYDETAQKKVYLDFLKRFKTVDFDAIGLSFIQNDKILKLIRKLYPKLILVAKIENIKGMENLTSICTSSDVIMIDRGDLSAEIGENNLFAAITQISRTTKEYGKSLIMATENLDSMMIRKSPTKSEIVSIGHSLMLNADKIMLSDETATSEKWADVLQWLNEFIKFNDKNIYLDKKTEDDEAIIWNMVSKIDNLPIIIFSKKGFAIEKINQVNNTIDLTVFTDNKKTETLCKFRANTKVILISKFGKNKESLYIYNSIKTHKNYIFKNNNKALLIYVSYPRKNSRANSFTLISKKDFY